MPKTPKNPKTPKLAQLPKPEPGSIGDGGNRLGDSLPKIGRIRAQLLADMSNPPEIKRKK